MKKTYSDKFIIHFSIFGIIIFSSASIVCIFSLIYAFINKKMNEVIAYSVFLPEFLFFIVISFVVLNRHGCKVIYNPIENTITRKGFVCGYKYQLKIEDIREIIISSFPKENTCYVLVDSVNTRYEGGYKNSFIRLEKNDKNAEFIKQFWDKPILTKEYTDLLNQSSANPQ